MRYVRATAALLVLGLTWVLGPATPLEATGDDTVVVVTQIDGTPDNGCPPWARDSLKRTTTLSEEEYGVRVSFHDEGAFTLPDGRQGTVQGDVTYHDLDGEIITQDGAQDSLDNSGYPCKEDVPPERTVGQWPLRYLDAEDTPELKSWEWTYTLCGVSFTENADSEEVGPDRFPPADSEECQPPPTPTTTLPDPGPPPAPPAQPQPQQPTFTG